MYDYRAENLLRIAKRHLDGSDGAPERNVGNACDLLRALIGLYPRSRAAEEALEILNSHGKEQLE